jgi:hypothetical protein
MANCLKTNKSRIPDGKLPNKLMYYNNFFNILVIFKPLQSIHGWTYIITTYLTNGPPMIIISIFYENGRLVLSTLNN